MSGWGCIFVGYVEGNNPNSKLLADIPKPGTPKLPHFRILIDRSEAYFQE